MKLSFVITIYNKAPYLRDVVASLVRQKGLPADQEYVFIDDGSNDGSGELLTQLLSQLPNARLITQENQGPAKATNNGVKAALGQYVRLVDGDDLLPSQATAVMLELMEEHQAQLITGKLGTYKPGELPDFPVLRKAEIIPNSLECEIKTGLATSSGTMFERQAFLQAGGCDEEVFIQDFPFFLRMAAQGGKFLKMEEVTALVPEIPGGRVSDMTGQALHDMNRAILNLLRANPRALSSELRLIAMRKGAGRVWKWGHRHMGDGIFSASFLTFCLSKLPLPGWAEWLLARSTLPFKRNPKLRIYP